MDHCTLDIHPIEAYHVAEPFFGKWRGKEKPCLNPIPWPPNKALKEPRGCFLSFLPTCTWSLWPKSFHLCFWPDSKQVWLISKRVHLSVQLSKGHSSLIHPAFWLAGHPLWECLYLEQLSWCSWCLRSVLSTGMRYLSYSWCGTALCHHFTIAINFIFYFILLYILYINITFFPGPDTGTCVVPLFPKPRHKQYTPRDKESSTAGWHVAARHMKIHFGLETYVSSSAVQWTVLFIAWEKSWKL